MENIKKDLIGAMKGHSTSFRSGALFAMEYLEEHGFIPATLEATEEEPDKRYKPLPDCPLPVEHLTEKQKQELIYGKPEDWSKGQVTLQQLQEVKDQAERLLNKIQDLRDQQSASRSSWKPDHDAPEMIHSFLQDCRSTAKSCKNILDVAILERSNNPAS